jgi:hypothetical protein
MKSLISLLSVTAATYLISSPAFAVAPAPELPAPGIIGIVAGGVIAAVALAHLRK